MLPSSTLLSTIFPFIGYQHFIFPIKRIPDPIPLQGRHQDLTWDLVSKGQRTRWHKESLAVSTVSPSICHEVMGPDAMILVFWMLGFKPTFSLSSFTFIKRLFCSPSLSAIRVVSSAYLRLLIFLLALLISACDLSSWHCTWHTLK